MLIAPNVRANQPPPPPSSSAPAPPAEALEALEASLMAFSPFVGFARDERNPRRGAVTTERTERMPLLIADDGFGLLPLLPTGMRPVAGGVPETTLVADDEAKLVDGAPLLMPEMALLIPLALLTLEAVDVVVDDLADVLVGFSTGAAAPATGTSPCLCATAAGRAPLRDESTPKPIGPMRRKGARLWRAEPTASWLDVGTAYDGPANEVLEHAVSRRALLVALRALASYNASTAPSAPGW